MPARVRIAAAALVAALALVGVVIVVVRARADQNGVGRLRFATTSPAEAPFGEFVQARVAVGGRCVRVLVASTPAQRSQGLRGVQSLAPYAGMLFVNPSDTRARFTMADTQLPLRITFFSADGSPVDAAQMVPCPSGSDATCPEYESAEPYRYALERPGSAPAASALGSC